MFLQGSPCIFFASKLANFFVSRLTIFFTNIPNPFLSLRRGFFSYFLWRKERSKETFFHSFSGAENEPRDIHLTRALPYMEGA